MGKVQDLFIDRLMDAIDQKRSHVIVGLDPTFENIPEHLKKQAAKKFDFTFQAIAESFLEFNKKIIDVVKDHVPAVKPQMAFYEKYGYYGVKAFEETVKYAKQNHLIVIEDAKRGDIGSTTAAYSDGHLGKVEFWNNKRRPSFDVDCITISPYLGYDAVKSFVEDIIKYGKGAFICVKTSSKLSTDLQDLEVKFNKRSMRLYETVAELVNRWGNKTIGRRGYQSLGAVVGATFPKESRILRAIMPRAYFLVPGYGAQGARAEDITYCFNPDGYGAIISSSRDIIFAYQKDPWRSKFDASKFEKASEKAIIQMKEDINNALRKQSKLSW